MHALTASYTARPELGIQHSASDAWGVPQGTLRGLQRTRAKRDTQGDRCQTEALPTEKQPKYAQICLYLFTVSLRAGECG